ncbi:hypothetical protein [Streptomyces sp. HUAS ZL42]|uniref:hypothetical protein n=1 Tax=Streptomyces sp. HUAS ZL42 TaxID=3231715 RepID=UPI00345E34C2
MTFDLEAEREAAIARLSELEEIALEAGKVAGRDVTALVSRLRATRARWERRGRPRVVRVQVPAGASPEERRNAVIAAAVERLNDEEDEDD